MIARLVGTVAHHDATRVVLDVRDVGYAVVAAARDIASWVAAAGPVVVWVHTDVREDAITLYGFSEDADRVAFEKLRLVDGIGPKVALSALDTLGRAALAAAVERDDLTALCRVPGVGKRLAQRMALELKGKLAVDFAPTEATAPVAATAGMSVDDPLFLGLASLGYTRAEAQRAAAALLREGRDHEPLGERLRAALAFLSGSRTRGGGADHG